MNYNLPATRVRQGLLMLKLFMFIFLINNNDLKGQVPSKVWDKTYGGISEESGGIILQASGGGYILAGTSNSVVSGEKSEASKGGNDFWIVKVDNNGNKLWDKTYGGAGEELLSAIIPTSDGGYLLGGRSSSEISGDVSGAGKGLADFWVIKINGSGVKQWDKRFGGSGNDILSDISLTSDGGYLLLGSSASNIGGDKSEVSRGSYDYWMVKVDASFNKQWDKTYGGNKNDFLVSAVEAHGGGYLLGGTSDSDISGDKTQTETDRNTYSGGEIWLIKVDNALQKEWDMDYPGHKDSKLTKLIKTSDGQYLVAGTNHRLDYSDRDMDNYYIFKISITGAITNSRIFGGSYNDILTSISPTPDGGYVLAGNSNSTNVGDKTEPNIGGADSNSYDFWLLKVDASLNQLWDKTIGGTDHDLAASVLVTPDGGYLIAGTSRSEISGHKTQNSRGGSDLWVVKLAHGMEVKVTDFTFNKTGRDVQISATVVNSDQASKVEFYANGVKLGEDISAPFQYTWSHPHPGTYYVHLKVYTKSGTSSVSFTKPFTNHLYNVELYRAINLNGPGYNVDGVNFGDFWGSPDFSWRARTFEGQHITLNPQAKFPLSRILKSSIYSTKTSPATLTFTNVPKGPYEVYLYVWEDNYPSTYSIKVNGNVALSNHNSGSRGTWAKLGPFKTNVQDQIVIIAEGGEANISAIEVYKIKDYEMFYKAVNLNGPTIKIDNLNFESSSTITDFEYEGRTFANQSIPLIPSTDANRAEMIRSSVYSTKLNLARFNFENVPTDYVQGYPEALYSAYIYVWEDNLPSSFYIQPYNQGDPQYFQSGKKGEWKIIGPILLYTARGFDLGFEAGGGDGNISGIELWKLPASAISAAASTSAESSTSAFRTVVYPNSISDLLKVQLPGAEKGKITVKITDLVGRTYLNKRKDLKDENSFTLDVPTEDMEKGIYILQLQHPNGKSETIRLNKE